MNLQDSEPKLMSNEEIMALHKSQMEKDKKDWKRK